MRAFSILFFAFVVSESSVVSAQEWRELVEDDEYLIEVMSGISQRAGRNALLEDEAWLTDGARVVLIELVSENRSNVSVNEWIEPLDRVLDYAEQYTEQKGEVAIDRTAMIMAWAWGCRFIGWPFCAESDLEEAL